MRTVADLLIPPSEIELAELVQAMKLGAVTEAGMLIMRRLLWQRDKLKEDKPMGASEVLDNLADWLDVQLDGLREISSDEVKNAAFAAYFQTQKVVSKLRKGCRNGR